MRTRGFLLVLCLCLCLCSPLPGEEGTARQYTMIERYWPAELEAGQNPYDPDSVRLDARITLPSGASRIVPLFHDRPCQRGRDALGKEWVKPSGPARWALRFTPRDPGEHSVVILRTSGGRRTEELERFALSVKPAEASARGFLRVNPERPERFVFDSGEGYFALGHNVCWTTREQGTYGYDRYFRRMAKAGENYTRVWLCTWGISLDTEKPYTVDLTDAWRLDHVLSEAQRRGLYVKLCIDNFYDHRYHWDQSPFNRANGGPCATPLQRFTSVEADRLTRARMRYLVARYGAFTSLLAYELWNEMEYAIGSLDRLDAGLTDAQIRDRVYLPWTLRTARALQQMDSHDHLVTTSLGMHTHWEGLWDESSIQIAQYHSYIHYTDMLRTREEEDAAAFALRGVSHITGHGKPALLSEFGYMGEGSHSSMNPKDPKGIALHNSLWAGAFSGAAGTPMLWWWDNYIDPNDLYFRYQSLATYLKGVDWTLDFKPMRAEDPDVRVLALRSPTLTLLWLQNRKSTWHEQLRRKRRPARLADIQLALDGFTPGAYQLSWYDPQAGRELSSHEVQSPDGSLRLRVPAFRHDIAAKLRLVRKRP